MEGKIHWLVWFIHLFYDLIVYKTCCTLIKSGKIDWMKAIDPWEYKDLLIYNQLRLICELRCFERSFLLCSDKSRKKDIKKKIHPWSWVIDTFDKFSTPIWHLRNQNITLSLPVLLSENVDKKMSLHFNEYLDVKRSLALLHFGHPNFRTSSEFSVVLIHLLTEMTDTCPHKNDSTWKVSEGSSDRLGF